MLRKTLENLESGIKYMSQSVHGVVLMGSLHLGSQTNYKQVKPLTWASSDRLSMSAGWIVLIV